VLVHGHVFVREDVHVCEDALVLVFVVSTRVDHRLLLRTSMSSSTYLPVFFYVDVRVSLIPWSPSSLLLARSRRNR